VIPVFKRKGRRVAIMSRFLTLVVVATTVAGLAAVALVDSAQAACEYPIANLDACPRRTPYPSPFKNERKGCGPGDNALNENFAGVNFRPACAEHDECYQTCNKDKSVCDKKLGDDLWEACNRGLSRYPGKLFWCLFWAKTYHMVPTHHGSFAYNYTQERVCQCCTMVYCPCNKKCYPDAVSCTAECRKGVGICTGLVLPALCVTATADHMCP